MNVSSISKSALFFILTAGLGVSCASVDGLEVDKSFTYQSLGQRGLMVMDLQKADHIKLKGIQVSQLRNLLESEIRDERDDFKLASIDPKVNSSKLLVSFKQNNDLSVEQLKSLPNQRAYLALGSLSADSTKRSQAVDKDDDGKPTNYKYNSERSMTVTFKVYDLEKKKLVWSGDVNKSLTETANYDRSEHKSRTGVNETVQTVNAIETWQV